MEPASQIPWRRVGVEGVVIVGSILIAFAIDAAWDGQQERAAEREVLIALEQDMLDTQAEVSRVVEAEAALTASLEALLDASADDLAGLSQEAALEILLGLARTPTFGPYDGSIRGGQLVALRDPELRRALGTWAGSVADVVDVNPLLMENIRVLRLSMGSRVLEYLYTPGGDATTDSAPQILAELRRNEAFIAARLTAQATHRQNLRKVQDLGEMTTRVLALIRARLEGGAF